LAVLTDFLGPGRAVEADAEVWESYYRVHDPLAEEQLAALRAVVR
jgi:hypothetical protein